MTLSPVKRSLTTLTVAASMKSPAPKPAPPPPPVPGPPPLPPCARAFSISRFASTIVPVSAQNTRYKFCPLIITLPYAPPSMIALAVIGGSGPFKAIVHGAAGEQPVKTVCAPDGALSKTQRKSPLVAPVDVPAPVPAGAPAAASVNKFTVYVVPVATENGCVPLAPLLVVTVMLCVPNVVAAPTTKFAASVVL